MNTTAIEGQIDIELFPQLNRGSRVKIHSSRPVKVSKVMIGKPVESVLSMIPLIYNICGIAQSNTCLKAVQQNLNLDQQPAEENAREMLVLAETAREHLFRIFVDWPKLFNLDSSILLPPSSAQQLNKFKQALFINGDAFSLSSELKPQVTQLKQLIDNLEQDLQQQVFNTASQNWLNMNNIDELNQWMQKCDSMAARSIRIIMDKNWAAEGFSDCLHLPELGSKDLLKRFTGEEADNFITQPDWKGHHYETTTLTRQQHHPLIQQLMRQFNNALITRWIARLIELASIPQQLGDLLTQLEHTDTTVGINNNTTGLAQTEAARGRLIHHVQIKQNLINNYQILAPTEWNFHPQGLISKSLQNITAKDPVELEKISRLLINAIDPCVGYKLRIH